MENSKPTTTAHDTKQTSGQGPGTRRYVEQVCSTPLQLRVHRGRQQNRSTREGMDAMIHNQANRNNQTTKQTPKTTKQEAHTTHKRRKGMPEQRAKKKEGERGEEERTPRWRTSSIPSLSSFIGPTIETAPRSGSAKQRTKMWYEKNNKQKQEEGHQGRGKLRCHATAPNPLPPNTLCVRSIGM